MAERAKPLAVVTGASAGIGYGLAKWRPENGFARAILGERQRKQAAPGSAGPTLSERHP